MTKIVDGFVWLLVTNKAKEVFQSGLFELYILYDDGSENRANNMQDINNALAAGLDMGIEVGHIVTSSTIQ
jgi:hypothetical protein